MSLKFPKAFQCNRYIPEIIYTFSHHASFSVRIISNSFQVLVLEAGEIQEFDIPHILLQDSHGLFNDMVRKTGQGTADALRKIAKEVK